MDRSPAFRKSKRTGQKTTKVPVRKRSPRAAKRQVSKTDDTARRAVVRSARDVRCDDARYRYTHPFRCLSRREQLLAGGSALALTAGAAAALWATSSKTSKPVTALLSVPIMQNVRRSDRLSLPPPPRAENLVQSPVFAPVPLSKESRSRAHEAGEHWLRAVRIAEAVGARVQAADPKKLRAAKIGALAAGAGAGAWMLVKEAKRRAESLRRPRFSASNNAAAESKSAYLSATKIGESDISASKFGEFDASCAAARDISKRHVYLDLLERFPRHILSASEACATVRVMDDYEVSKAGLLLDTKKYGSEACDDIVDRHSDGYEREFERLSKVFSSDKFRKFSGLKDIVDECRARRRNRRG